MPGPYRKFRASKWIFAVESGPGPLEMTKARPLHHLTLGIRGVLLACLAVSSACGTPPETDRPPGSEPPTMLRVLTWNIHHGRGLDGAVDIERIAREIRASGADLVALQEVDVGTDRVAGQDLAGALGRACGMHAVFQRNIPFQNGEYGNAILSRWPVGQVTNHHFSMLREGEQRGCLVATIEHPNRFRIRFASTHIDYRPDDTERVAHAHEILGLVAEDPTSLWLVAGDFNDLPGSQTYRVLATELVDGWRHGAGEGAGATYPAGAPTKRIDYIWLRYPSDADGASRHAPGASSAVVLDTSASDHAGLLLSLVHQCSDRAGQAN